MELLKETFWGLGTEYTENTRQISELWEEIERNYTNKKRHYHTLAHLENLLGQLTQVKTVIQQWDAVLFSLYYHDIIYNPLRSDNEEKSAKLAEKRMMQLTVPIGMIERSKEQILATRSHGSTVNSDTNLFIDADLSILGQPWENYLEYCKGIRKEYAIYPDVIYNAGRKKVLNHFLAMDRIFKTEFFYNKLEIQAKKNLLKELNLLN